MLFVRTGLEGARWPDSHAGMNAWRFPRWGSRRPFRARTGGGFYPGFRLRLHPRLYSRRRFATQEFAVLSETVLDVENASGSLREGYWGRPGLTPHPHELAVNIGNVRDAGHRHVQCQLGSQQFDDAGHAFLTERRQAP